MECLMMSLNGGVTPQPIPNPNLTWYEITMYNLGLDFGFFENKLSGSFELFQTRQNRVTGNKHGSCSGYSWSQLASAKPECRP
jgi:hypothetical protein